MYVFYADFISFYYIGPTWVCSKRTTFPCKSGSHYSNNSKWNEAKKWHNKNVIKYVLLNTICIFHWHSFHEYTLTQSHMRHVRIFWASWESVTRIESLSGLFFRCDEHKIWLKHIFLRLNYFFLRSLRSLAAFLFDKSSTQQWKLSHASANKIPV